MWFVRLGGRVRRLRLRARRRQLDGAVGLRPRADRGRRNAQSHRRSPRSHDHCVVRRRCRRRSACSAQPTRPDCLRGISVATVRPRTCSRFPPAAAASRRPRKPSPPASTTEDGRQASVPTRRARSSSSRPTTTLARGGFTADDVRWFVPHQANARIIDAAGERLGFGPERTLVQHRPVTGTRRRPRSRSRCSKRSTMAGSETATSYSARGSAPA